MRPIISPDSSSTAYGSCRWRRVMSSNQRERCYDEIASVEKRESEITKTFAGATVLAQRRIATEIAQLRKNLGPEERI